MRMRLFGLLPLLALLAAWQGAVLAGLYPAVLLPAPAKVRGAFVLDGPSIVANAAASVTRVVVGVGLAFCVAVPAGLLIGRYPAAGPADRLVDPDLPLRAAHRAHPAGHAVLRHRRHARRSC